MTKLEAEKVGAKAGMSTAGETGREGEPLGQTNRP